MAFSEFIDAFEPASEVPPVWRSPPVIAANTGHDDEKIFKDTVRQGSDPFVQSDACLWGSSTLSLASSISCASAEQNERVAEPSPIREPPRRSQSAQSLGSRATATMSRDQQKREDIKADFKKQLSSRVRAAVRTRRAVALESERDLLRKKRAELQANEAKQRDIIARAVSRGEERGGNMLASTAGQSSSPSPPSEAVQLDDFKHMLENAFSRPLLMDPAVKLQQYYQILGLEIGASPDEIQSKYEELMHSDRQSGGDPSRADVLFHAYTMINESLRKKTRHKDPDAKCPSRPASAGPTRSRRSEDSSSLDGLLMQRRAKLESDTKKQWAKIKEARERGEAKANVAKVPSMPDLDQRKKALQVAVEERKSRMVADSKAQWAHINDIKARAASREPRFC